LSVGPPPPPAPPSGSVYTYTLYLEEQWLNTHTRLIMSYGFTCNHQGSQPVTACGDQFRTSKISLGQAGAVWEQPRTSRSSLEQAGAAKGKWDQPRTSLRPAWEQL
jgi:hypothetical protein